MIFYLLIGLLKIRVVMVKGFDLERVIRCFEGQALVDCLFELVYVLF